MLSEELKALVKALADKYRQRPSNVIWAANRFPHFPYARQKPRFRVKAISQRWSPLSKDIDRECREG